MKRAALAFVFALTTGGAASAQDRDGWSFTIGSGGLYAPSYEGDDNYRLSILPSIEARYGDRFFASVQNGVGYRWVNGETLRAGPIGRVKFSRNEDGQQAFAVSGEDSDDLVGLGDVDATVELGGFVEYDVGAINFTAEARQAVSGHQSWVSDFGASWRGSGEAFGQDVIWSVGPRARFVGKAYNTTYFGVTPAQSLASGLPIYQASGGLHSYGLAGTIVVPLSSDGGWSLTGIAGFDRLTDDAGDSPLVDQRGADEQVSIGFFVTRRL